MSHTQRTYTCPPCNGPNSVTDNLITINVEGHAVAAHRDCPL